MAKLDFDKNTWIEGMDQDTSKSKFQPNKYYELRNAHVVTHKGTSTGAIENEEGTTLLITLPDIPSSTTLGLTNNTFPLQTGIRIIGWKFYRSDLIVISTNSSGAVSTGHIWLIPFNIGTNLPTETIDVTKHLKFVGALNLSPNYRIKKIIPRYEFGTHAAGGYYKIYFTDGYNGLRHLNLYESASYLTGTKIIDIPVNSLEVLSDIGYFSPIILDKVVTGGSYTAGMVQYAYQYYKLFGVESRYSPASKLIHLTDSNEYDTDSSNYFGSPIDTATGKAVRIIIPASPNTLFDRVRVVSLFYNTYTSTPEIKVIADLDAIATTTTIIDTNTPTIDVAPTLVEFTTLGGNAFICQDMEVKDNRLLPVNITTLAGFNPTWDARAYRFTVSPSPQADIYSSDEATSYTIYGDTPVWTISEDFDCYNKFNEIKQGNDANTALEYMYQTNGATLGGEGPNIEYEFVIKSIVIDSGNEDIGDITTAMKVQAPLDGADADLSYTNYASPYIHSEFVGYMRDEIISFGIEFFDTYGRQSFAKWIADIRLPRIYDLDYNVTYSISSTEHKHDFAIAYKNEDDLKNYGNILGVKFTLKSVPTGATAWRIVRCPITSADRTNAFQGLLQHTIVSNISDISTPNVKPNSIDEYFDNALGGVFSYQSKLHTIDSPDPVFFSDSFYYNSGDFVTISAVYKGLGGAVGKYFPFGSIYLGCFKFTTTEIYTTIGGVAPGSNTHAVVTAKIVTPSEDGGTPIRIGTYDFNNYSVYGVDHPTIRGTNTVVSLSTSLVGENALVNFYLANYKRNIIPYGGNSFASRTQRTYIPCSDITAISTLTLDVYGGDTYISFYTYLKNFIDYSTTGDHSRGDNILVIFPVETRINLDLRHDKLLQWYKRMPTSYIPTLGSMTASDATFTSLYGYNFTAADVGKAIKVTKVGTAGVDMTGTIASLTSSTVVELSFTAVTSSIEAVLTYTEVSSQTFWAVRETQAKGLELFPNTYPSDITDLYLYNSVYSKENSVNTYYPEPLNYTEVTQYGTRFKASEKRISGNTIDQYLDFSSNIYKDVDSPYGDINAVKLFKNQLYFFQDSGIGVMPVNERATIVDESGTNIVLGEGEILGKYGYVSRTVGCKHSASIVDTDEQLHFFDIRLKKWFVYNDSLPLPLSSISGLHSYFGETILSDYTYLSNDTNVAVTPYGIHGVWDVKNNRVLMTFLGSTKKETVVYNLFKNNFEQFIDFSPILYVQVGNSVLGVSNGTAVRNKMYQLGTGNYGTYFEVTTPYDTVVKFISNKYPDNTKVFTSIEYNSILELSGTESYDAYGNSETFNMFRMLNDYQTTGFKNLVVYNDTNPTNDPDDVFVKRRLRTWRFKVPRSLQMSTSDKADARMRGQYTYLELRFTNNANKRLILHDVTTYFIL